MTDGLRAEAMKRRLTRTAGGRGITGTDAELLLRAFDLGMEPRFAAGVGDHHPDYLHPSRTALILMDDARIEDAAVIAAALVTETRSPGFAVSAADLERLGSRVHAIVSEIANFGPMEDTLAERLVGASMDARLVAIAERLDHARHLHLRGRDEWAQYHAATCGTYAPVAHRTDAAMAGRIDWWCTTFRERFLDD